MPIHLGRVPGSESAGGKVGGERLDLERTPWWSDLEHGRGSLAGDHLPQRGTHSENGRGIIFPSPLPLVGPRRREVYMLVLLLVCSLFIFLVP